MLSQFYASSPSMEDDLTSTECKEDLVISIEQPQPPLRMTTKKDKG